MKNRFPCYWLLVLLPVLACPTLSHADAVPPVAAPARRNLPILEAAPSTVVSGGVVTLLLPPGIRLTGTRLRVGLFEAGRPIRVAEAVRDFTLRDGRYQATVSIQGDPGQYEFRIVSEDRLRSPLSTPALVVVPGLRREPGTWLFNGSPFLQSSPDQPDVSSTATNKAPLDAPLFVPGLRRDIGRKSGKPQTRSLTAPVLLQWKVITLPPMRDMMASGYNFDALRADLARQMSEAQARGERLFLGVALPSDGAATFPVLSANVISNVRAILNRLAPNAALILYVNNQHQPTTTVREISACAALCDAVAVEVRPHYPPSIAWPIKAARKVAEEQANYDLPIFAVVSRDYGMTGRPPVDQWVWQAALDCWMSGVTGVVENGSLSNGSGILTDRTGWGPIVQRNASLFAGSVTLEDTGLLPTPDAAENSFRLGQPDDLNENLPPDPTDGLYSLLRLSGRVPLLARTANPTNRTRFGESGGEPFVVALGERVSDATVAALVATARAGGRIYVEGAPLLDERGRPAWKLGPLVGATATALPRPADAPAVPTTSCILDDSWTFGTARATRIAVAHAVSIKLNPVTPSKDNKPKKGMDVLTGPRIVAHLEDGSPGIIVNPVGKGEVMWVPNPPSLEDFPFDDGARPGGLRDYYSAIGGYLQAGLVDVRGASSVRVAVRRSPQGTLIVALLNSADAPVTVTAAISTVADVALDLSNETELPLTTRGALAEVTVTIPASGWKVIALAETRRQLDEERFMPRLQARLR